MIGENPEFRRTVADIRTDTETWADWMTTIGAFAMRHDMAITVGESPEGVTEPSIRVIESADPQYNPELVTWLTDPKSEVRLPLITKSKLHEFEQTHSEWDRGRAERIYNCLRVALRPYKPGSDVLPDYLTMDGSNLIGIRADRVRELLSLLKDGAIEVTNLGAKSIKFLEMYCQELFPPTQDTN